MNIQQTEPRWIFLAMSFVLLCIGACTDDAEDLAKDLRDDLQEDADKMRDDIKEDLEDGVDDIKDSIEGSFDLVLEPIPLTVEGLQSDQEDLIFEEDIPDWEDIRDRIRGIEVTRARYMITKNSGGAGSGQVFMSSFQDDSDKMLVATLEVGAGQLVANLTNLPFESGALTFINGLIDTEQLSVYFEGDATDVNFKIELVLTVNVTVGP